MLYCRSGIIFLSHEKIKEVHKDLVFWLRWSPGMAQHLHNTPNTPHFLENTPPEIWKFAGSNLRKSTKPINNRQNPLIILYKIRKNHEKMIIFQKFYIFQQTPLIFAKAHYFNIKIDLRSGFFANLINFHMLFLSFK